MFQTKNTIFTVDGVDYNVSVYMASSLSPRGKYIINIENPNRHYIKAWNYWSKHVWDEKSPAKDSFQYKIFSYVKENIIPDGK